MGPVCVCVVFLCALHAVLLWGDNLSDMLSCCCCATEERDVSPSVLEFILIFAPPFHPCASITSLFGTCQNCCHGNIESVGAVKAVHQNLTQVSLLWPTCCFLIGSHTLLLLVAVAHWFHCPVCCLISGSTPRLDSRCVTAKTPIQTLDLLLRNLGQFTLKFGDVLCVLLLFHYMGA